MSTHDESLHPRSQDTGKFKAKTHADPTMSLGTGPDPEKTVAHVLNALGVSRGPGSVYSREKKLALEAGEATVADVFAELVAGNRKGKCKRHEYNPADTASYCRECRVALATEAAVTQNRSAAALSEPGPDPEETVDRVFDRVGTTYGPGSEYVREKKQALAAGETTAAEVFEELAANNSNGKCQRHEHDPGMTASYCDGCRLAMTMEAAVNPGPTPVPVGDAPRPGPNHFVKPGEELSHEWDPDSSSNTTTQTMTGDESFEAAVRKMLGAPPGAKVTVTDQTTEYGDYTKEYVTEITVEAGGVSARFDGLGALMRTLDEKDENGPLEMAMRLMRATDARRPLLSGPAAIYPKQRYGQSAEPIFAHVTQVFSSQRDPQIQLLHLDGRSQFIYAAQIAAITETDQTEIYGES